MAGWFVGLCKRRTYQVFFLLFREIATKHLCWAFGLYYPFCLCWGWYFIWKSLAKQYTGPSGGMEEWCFSLLRCSSMSHVRQNSRYRRGQGNSACFAADCNVTFFKRCSFRSIFFFKFSTSYIISTSY